MSGRIKEREELECIMAGHGIGEWQAFLGSSRVSLDIWLASVLSVVYSAISRCLLLQKPVFCPGHYVENFWYKEWY